jgi:NACHT domain
MKWHKKQNVLVEDIVDLFEPAEEPDFDHAVDRAINHAMAEEDSTPTSLDHIGKALDLLNISSSQRARATISKCLKTMELEDNMKKTPRYTTALRRIKTTDLGQGIKDIAAEKIVQRQRKFESAVKRKYSDATSRCLKSLLFTDMGAIESSIEQPAKDTCKWIYEDDLYQLWASQTNTLLWIKGKPGSGKSTLMKSLHRSRKQTTHYSRTIHLGFFFNARGVLIERTPLGLYITLLFGLLRQIPLAMCEFLPIYVEKEFCSPYGRVTWQVTEVADVFHSIISQEQSTCIEIMIDALDECEDEEVRSIIRKFEKSIAAARSTGAELRVCWSSRYYPHISLNSEHGLELRMDEHNNLDIRRCVEEELPIAADPSLPFLKEELISRANGVFLWAVLVSRRVARAIDRGDEPAQLREFLFSIPVKLEGLFGEIFKNAEDSISKRHDLLRFSQWIFCSFRPLSLPELFTAVSFQAVESPHAFGSIEMSKDSLKRLENRITDASGGLFEVIQREDSTRVQVIHESVREFFLGSNGLRLLQVSSREMFLTLGHKELALACFKAVLAKEFDSILPRPKLGRTESITEVLKYLMGPWEPPRNAFLRTYVQDFVFKQFGQARDEFTNEPSTGTPFESLQVRRRVLANFLRFCCSRIMEDQTLQPNFSAHLQEVSVDPSAFNLDSGELLTLISFLNNVSASSSLLTSKHMYMHKDIPSYGNMERFIALFYLYPDSQRPPASHLKVARKENSSRYVDSTSELDTAMIRSAFGMSFHVHSDGGKAKRRLQDKISHPLPLPRSDLDDFFEPVILSEWTIEENFDDFVEPVILSEWAIEENLDDFVEFRKYRRVVEDFPRARLHEYDDVRTLCLIFRYPTEDEIPSVEVSKEELFVGYGLGSMPKEYWWRPRERGRDRDTFEADINSDSEHQARNNKDNEGLGEPRLRNFPTTRSDSEVFELSRLSFQGSKRSDWGASDWGGSKPGMIYGIPSTLSTRDAVSGERNPFRGILSNWHNGRRVIGKIRDDDSNDRHFEESQALGSNPAWVDRSESPAERFFEG